MPASKVPLGEKITRVYRRSVAGVAGLFQPDEEPPKGLGAKGKAKGKGRMSGKLPQGPSRI